MKPTSVTLLHDTSPGGTGRFYVSVTIGNTGRPLGSYDNVNAAAEAMGKWVRDRGLRWAPDSARRLSEAQRTDAVVLTLDVWPAADVEAHAENRRSAWKRADYDPYIHTAYRMTPTDTFPWLTN